MASATACLIFLLSHLIVLLLTASAEAQKGYDCPSAFKCGALGTFSYPFTTVFYPRCGICVINCNDTIPTLGLSATGPWFTIMNTFSNNRSFLVSDSSLQYVSGSDTCDTFKGRTVRLPKSSSVIFTNLLNVSIWLCRKRFNRNRSSNGYFNLILECPSYDIYQRSNAGDGRTPSSCEIFQYPQNLMVELSDKCSQCISGGDQCQDLENDKFQCINKRKEKKMILLLGIVATSSSLGAVVLITFMIICVKRRLKSKRFTALWTKGAIKNQNLEAFLKSYGSLAPKIYTYAEIRRITNNFKEKLGEGGYGAVYKGKLHDSRFVAVKNLKRLKGDGDDFINEVVSIGRTNHVNVVTLLGFCFEGDQRALVYEFLPNGSLEKYIYDAASCQSLPSKTLFSTVVSIAKGLDYLHRGCNARILHLDIKPHNILLDDEFHPKISDFGLARLCPAMDSLVSMSEARGTIGYIAPEVFCRNNFGGVSHKSDVYSYGMMLLDLVCGRRIEVAEAQHSSEMYFPDWIYRQLDLGEETEVHGIMKDEEKELKRKMIMGGLWCIQSYPSNRPPMNRVIEMLEGSLESLQMPPKPHPSSPLNTVNHSAFSSGY